MVDYINRDVKNLTRRGSLGSKIAAVTATVVVGLGAGYLQNHHENAVRNKEADTALKQQRDASAEYAKYEAEQSPKRRIPSAKANQIHPSGV